MTNGNRGKLNQLQQLPDGALVDAAWLERRGYSSSLRSQYVKAGWLNQPAPRVYRRGNGPLGWREAIISLQTFLESDVTVGGRSALEELGYGHYLGRRREVHLYGAQRPPGWLAALPLEVEFVWHNSQRLFPDDPVVTQSDDAQSGASDEPLPFLRGGFLISGGTAKWGLRLASAERALFQLLDELPSRETFHQVDMLMEGLANLSPRSLQAQLASCTSIKVKRLFFYFADRHRHAWLERLDRSAVDLGTGKRMLVKGGKLDPTYLITVPDEPDGLS
ncbi:type IV toxin-antitoxin system AbiEi family antitoxin [Novosphingobium profundi]|uniref:type IV toxin-antitoxin system AbiEi family antitoxin domain-containing protein n=1 Tax=Novosphingobium profundi TaxID=1774954 RepID=UPI001BDADE85|nr:type IV toxin-antitoxin system AbiEi family antitoxin domain-containing protein [Novosphingobium profundi]MBT0667361.1 type IV toxin-antitoxin system AbiEi family antitoxin [Novosphingobium profundi]